MCYCAVAAVAVGTEKQLRVLLVVHCGASDCPRLRPKVVFIVIDLQEKVRRACSIEARGND